MSARPARVTVTSSGAPSREVLLEPGRQDGYIVGRSQGCDLCINDPAMSRRHARLVFSDDAWQVHDLDSKNGTLVAGRRAQQARLEKDEWLGMGSRLLHFELLGDSQLQAIRTRRATQLKIARQGKNQLDPRAGVGPILDRLLTSVLQLTGTERGFTLLTLPDGDLEVASTKDMDSRLDDNAEFAGSRGAVLSVLSTRQQVIACDTAGHAALGRRESVVAGGIRALVCLPLAIEERVLGILYADSSAVGKVFSELDIALLRELTEHAALSIAAAQLDDELDLLEQAAIAQPGTMLRLARNKQSLPNINQKTDAPGVAGLTGIRWSQCLPR